jgi:hypothetical protein
MIFGKIIETMNYVSSYNMRGDIKYNIYLEIG